MKLLLQIILIGAIVGLTLGLLFVTVPVPGVDY